jgi:hypothetical protein
MPAEALTDTEREQAMTDFNSACPGEREAEAGLITLNGKSVELVLSVLLGLCFGQRFTRLGLDLLLMIGDLREALRLGWCFGPCGFG